MVGGRHDSRGSVQIVDPGPSTAKGTIEPERWAIATHRVNVLIQGTSPFITATLAVLQTDLHEREFTWPDRPLAGNTASAAVLVREIGELSPHALDVPLPVLRSWRETQEESSDWHEEPGIP